MESMRKIVKKTICFVLYLLILVSFLMSGYTLAASNESNLISNAAKPAQSYERSGIIVSLGDSYSSGEGIEPFINQDKPDKYTDHDFLAHRSEKSWPGRLTINGEERNKENWFFVATSGATTWHLRNGFKKQAVRIEPNLIDPLFPHFYPEQTIAPQLDVFNNLNGKKADYVTLTLGGNDAGFADIILEAAVGSTWLNTSQLQKKIDLTWRKFWEAGGIRDSLFDAYRSIADAAGEQADIIIAGYPHLIDQNGKGMPFSRKEAEIINTAVSDFNNQIENIVNTVRITDPHIKIHFVSVEKEFYSKEAYSYSWTFEKECINRIILGAQEQDINEFKPASDYSMHPNDKGAAIYADCVQRKIDELEGEQAGANRDVVLSLDVSGSMSGQPINETKKAAASFIQSSLQEGARVGIVAYNYSASIYSDFSRIERVLQPKIDSLYANGGTNIEDGLRKAEEMLVSGNSKKQIIVLMSDGCPNNGLVGDELIEYAASIKEKGILIYTLGFFDAISGSDKTYAQNLMERIASEGCHYEVENAEDLVFFFEDMSDQISGQKYIYIRIACPVDVSVTYKGETLHSKPEKQNTRTSFGTLTFEESDKDYEGTDTRVKILRLKDGTDYDVKIKGNGIGRMNYTIGFMDENGEYGDIREFKNIRITKRTVINTVAMESAETVLNIDKDGDGKVDEQYKATENGRGRLVEKSNLPYVIGGVVAAVLLAVIITVIVHKLRKRKRNHATNNERCGFCGCILSPTDEFCGNCGNARGTIYRR